MLQLYEEFITQVEDALDRQSSLGRLSFWLEKNTRLASKPYSLKMWCLEHKPRLVLRQTKVCTPAYQRAATDLTRHLIS